MRWNKENKIKVAPTLAISLSIIFFFLFFFSFVGATDPTTIIFRPGELINISGIQCLNQNSTICGDQVDCNITIQYQNGSFFVNNGSMDILQNGFRGFDTGLTFTEPTILSSVTYCINGGVTPYLISIEYDTDFVDTVYGTYGLLIFVSFFFFILGLNKDRAIYRALSGFMLIIVGVVMIQFGFPNVTEQFITEGSGIILIGCGTAFIISDIPKLTSLFEK